MAEERVETGDLTTDGVEGPKSDDVNINSQFWTSPYGLDSSGNKLQRRDPKLQHRFKVVIPGFAFEDAPGNGPPDLFNDTPDSFNGVAWYAKSVDKPGLSVDDPDKDLYGTSIFKLISKPKVTQAKYKEINMVLVDPYYPNVTRKIARLFRRGGLGEAQAQRIIADAYGAGPTGQAASFLDTIGVVEIHQLNAKGQSIEKWTLFEAYPTSVDFGKLDYSSDGLVEISLTWYYTNFKVDFPNVGSEEAFRYFSDGSDIKIEDIRPNKDKEKTSCETLWKQEMQGLPENRVQDFDSWLKEGLCPGVPATSTPLPDPGETGAEEDSSTDAETGEETGTPAETAGGSSAPGGVAAGLEPGPV